MLAENHLLCLLQLASPTLPVGAYSYSEGLETLVENGTIQDRATLQHWLESELRYGAIRLEGAVMVRAYRSVKTGDLKELSYWNSWLSAARETEELRASSWQMGRSPSDFWYNWYPELRRLQMLLVILAITLLLLGLRLHIGTLTYKQHC